MNAVKRILGLSVAGIMVAATAYGTPPIPGQYTNLLGQVDDGRYAESFAAAGQFATVGNVNQTQSDDGANPLGFQWSYKCPELITPNLLQTIGIQEQWELIFDTTNATFVLRGAGEAWDDGGAPAYYTGVIDQYTETGWNTVFAGSWVGWNADVAWSGHFDAPYSQTCITWTANNVMATNFTYPGWIADDCSSLLANGTTGNQTDVGIDIHECLVPVEDSTWGAIKGLYR